MRTLVAVWCLLHALASSAQPAVNSRPSTPPFDGRGNNADNPTWGSAGSPMIRSPVSDVDFQEHEMAGFRRPSARAISAALMSSPYLKAGSRYGSTGMVTVMGQYATVEITKTPYVANATTGKTTTPGGSSVAIQIPPGDPFMSNFTEDGSVSSTGSRSAMSFTRSALVRDAAGVRQPVNSVTSFLDASAVYGSSADAAKRLRALSGGLLRDDGNRGLPFNEDPGLLGPGGQLVNITNVAKAVPASQLRAAGFGAVNMHPGQLALATVWLREHNRRAAEAVRLNPSAGDEEAFQYARKWVMAHVAHTVLDEYLPVLLGALLPLYAGYNVSADPSIDNFFATAAYRYGHSTVTNVVRRLDEKWHEHPQGHLLLSEVWFQPNRSLSAGIEPLLRGYVAEPQGQIEPRFASAVQQHLFGPAAINGSDLFALNIQRGRDHGLPDYNTCRRQFGLPPVTSFRNITPDAQLAAALESLYSGNLSNIDPYVGGLAEPHVGNAHVGALFNASIYDQFRRLRDGDWWFYQNRDNGLFSDAEVAEIDATGLRDIILRNTNITELPDSIWQLADDFLLGTCPSAASPAPGAAVPAGSSSGRGPGGAQVAGPFRLLGGELELVLSQAPDPGWVRVQMIGMFDAGYLGFGVAKPGQPTGQKMPGADIVIARTVNGQPELLNYHAAAHIPPTLDSAAGGTSNMRLLKFERAGGKTVVEFERPLAATDGNGLDVGITREGPNTFIVSHGLDDSLNYHGIDNRAVLEVSGALFGGKTSASQEILFLDPSAVEKRVQHGVLMAVNFILVFPLGALMARQLRARWITSLGFKAAMFYMHIGMQMCGVALGTAGFIIASQEFGVPYKQVLLHHGSLGVAVLAFVYSQLLVGFVRPPAAAALLRSVWQLSHALLGRSAQLLGAVNVFIGIYLLHTLYGGSIGLWGVLCAAGLGLIGLLQYTGDLLERRASEVLAARQADTTNLPKPSPPGGFNPDNSQTPIDNDLNPGSPGDQAEGPWSSGGGGLDGSQFKPYPGHWPGWQPPWGPPGGFFGGPGPSGFNSGGGMGHGVYWGPAPRDDGREPAPYSTISYGHGP